MGFNKGAVRNNNTFSRSNDSLSRLLYFEKQAFPAIDLGCLSSSTRSQDLSGMNLSSPKDSILGATQ